ncbi:MAG: nucleotidyltransferase family protein [Clostridiales bacterium]|nr:nucleotidyltransferase family protein [Clostridiales bacterium]
MNFEFKYFLKLVDCAIYNKDATAITPQNINWEEIILLARKHNMSAILYKTIERLPSALGPQKELMDQWSQEAFFYGLQQFRQNQEEEAILEEARKQGILCIPFKGLLLAELYPEPLMRISGDADILVDPKDKDKVIEILKNRGYVNNEHETIDTVFVYEKRGFLTVELHISLWEEYIGQRKLELEKLDLTNTKKLIEVTAANITFHTLGYEEHLIYQIYHVAKHFSLSGVGVRHLTDLTLYVNRFYDHIDFSHFWKVMKQLNYSVCCSYFFAICVECFGMRREALKDSMIQSEVDMEPIIEDVIVGGVFGNASKERYHARNIIKPYLGMEKTTQLKKSTILLRVAFPGTKILCDEYEYAKKHRILLPIAWIQRCFSLLRKRITGRDAYGKKTLEQAKYRLQLLKELEIINK